MYGLISVLSAITARWSTYKTRLRWRRTRIRSLIPWKAVNQDHLPEYLPSEASGRQVGIWGLSSFQQRHTRAMTGYTKGEL